MLFLVVIKWVQGSWGPDMSSSGDSDNHFQGGEGGCILLHEPWERNTAQAAPGIKPKAYLRGWTLVAALPSGLQLWPLVPPILVMCQKLV